MGERLNLRIQDLKLERGALVISGAKGVNNLIVSLPASRKAELHQQLARARTTWLREQHCLDRGTSPRAIQEAMGHANLETAMGYLHAESLSVPSPLDDAPTPPPLQAPSSGPDEL